MSELHLRHGAWDEVTPESAGWSYVSFRVVRGGGSFSSGEFELALVPLGGSAVVRADGGEWEIGGRASVFDGLPHALYLPRETDYELEGDAEIAICGARCERRREIRPILPEEIEIEVRGSGNATRQISHLVKPEFPAERLLVVEVYTPSGNWSSYPPHKHDQDHGDAEAVLEETYYYRVADEHSGGFAVQRLYSPGHGLDETMTIRDGDLVLVPWGYHTTAAAHGYDLYYLNTLAGDRRTMAAADDPELAWVRPAWSELEPDPRVPFVTAAGRRG